MKQQEDLEKLVLFLKAGNIALANSQVEQLKFYLDQLKSFGTAHRIISTKDLDHIVDKHFLSSFYFVKKIIPLLNPGDRLLDLGSGAGFPGILLSIVLSAHKVVMVDSIRKKTLFLKRLVKDLNLNCEIINKRIEDYQKECDVSFKVITARALAPIEELFQLAKPFLKDAELHTIKGKNYKEEIVNLNQIKYIHVEEFDKNWLQFSDYVHNKLYVTIKGC